MTTNTHNGRWSHRLGRGAGRAWRGYLRREQRVAGWLVTRDQRLMICKMSEIEEIAEDGIA